MIVHFRIERDGGLRVYRRADAPVEAVREALAAHHQELTHASAREGGVLRTRVGYAGGPIELIKGKSNK